MAPRWLVINEQNEVVVDEGWEWCRFATVDLLSFRADGRRGLYDWRNRKVVIQPSFKSITGPTDSVLVVRDFDSECCRLIDLNGRRVGQEAFWHVRDFVDGFAAASREEGAFGFINLAGEWVIPPKFYYVDDFSEGLSAVCSHSGEYFYVDRNGDAVIAGPFVQADPVSEGLARVRNENGDHFIDKTGNVILSGGQEWFHGGMFKCGRAWARPARTLGQFGKIGSCDSVTI